MNDPASPPPPTPRRATDPLARARPRSGRSRDPAGKQALFSPVVVEPPRDLEAPPPPVLAVPPEDEVTPPTSGEAGTDERRVEVRRSGDRRAGDRRAAPVDASGERLSDVDAWGRSERVRALVRAAYEPMYRHWFRVEWEGMEHIPREGGALLIANHAGAIPSDAPAIMHGIETELGRPVYGLAEHLFRAMPVVGTLWSRLGGVAAHPENAYRLLHEEQQLALVFPEGTKATGKHVSKRYQLARFGRGGFVEIAMRSGVPVVPIAVVGAEESMPILWNVRPLAKLLGVPYAPITANMLALGPAGLVAYFPAKFRIRVLPPVHFDVEPNEERYSRARVMEEAETIRQMVQEALYDMLRDRRSVWFG